MRQALVFQHMNHDHPGRFLDFFAEDNILPVMVRLWEGQEIPSLASFDFLFVLGGAQDSWQEDIYPWLGPEKAAIREWVVKRARPYFGVCLGHQLLCDALGGEVAPAAQAEVGVYEVGLSEEGLAHRLCEGIPSSSKVMQWHWAEVKKLPPEVTVLASSPLTRIQAVAVGNHALATQFHCEFTAQTMAGWSSLPSAIASLEKQNGKGAYHRLLAEATPLMPAMNIVTRQLYDNLMRATRFRAARP